MGRRGPLAVREQPIEPVDIRRSSRSPCFKGQTVVKTDAVDEDSGRDHETMLKQLGHDNGGRRLIELDFGPWPLFGGPLQSPLFDAIDENHGRSA